LKLEGFENPIDFHGAISFIEEKEEEREREEKERAPLWVNSVHVIREARGPTVRGATHMRQVHAPFSS
jgi:hypothetical protein